MRKSSNVKLIELTNGSAGAAINVRSVYLMLTPDRASGMRYAEIRLQQQSAKE
jgi:hypothetical protein